MMMNDDDLEVYVAILTDKSISEPEHLTERLLGAAQKSWTEVAKEPTGFVRCAPHDVLANGEPLTSAENGTVLREWIASAGDFDSVANDGDAAALCEAPESTQFINRYLPGHCRRDGWDGHPTNAQKWETFHSMYSEPLPFIELARRQENDAAADDSRDGVADSSADGYSNACFQPLTTKAGGRLWSISFAAKNPQAGDVSVDTLRASYPLQLSVRFDKGRQMLMYDALEHCPTLQNQPLDLTEDQRTAMKQFSAKSQGGDQNDIFSLLNRRQNSGGASGGAAAAAAAAEEEEEEEEEEEGGGAGGVGGQAGSQDTHGDYLAANYLRFKNSWINRVQFPVRAITGLRLVSLDKARPHAELPPNLDPRNRTLVSDLGSTGDDEEDSAIATGCELSGEELEPVGLLVLEMAAGVTPTFSKMHAWPVNKADRKRTRCKFDWTPGKLAAKATRHYIMGDLSEMLELARYLRSESLHVSAILDIGARAPNSLEGGANFILPENTPAGGGGAAAVQMVIPEPTAAVLYFFLLALGRYEQGLASLVQSMIGNIVLKTKKDMDSFLRAAGGLSGGNGINPCFMAAMSKGFVTVRSEWFLGTTDASEFMQSIDAVPGLEAALNKNPCQLCNRKMKCTMERLLNQGNYYSGTAGAAICTNTDCDAAHDADDDGETSQYVSLCDGNIVLNRAKFHNHCTECPDFGVCIGDRRNSHCYTCGDHYFAGTMGSFPCHACHPNAMHDDSWGDGGDLFRHQDDPDAVDPVAAFRPAFEAATARWDGVLPGATEMVDDRVEMHSVEWETMQRDSVESAREVVEPLRLTFELQAIFDKARESLSAPQVQRLAEKGFTFPNFEPLPFTADDHAAAVDRLSNATLATCSLQQMIPQTQTLANWTDLIVAQYIHLEEVFEQFTTALEQQSPSHDDHRPKRQRTNGRSNGGGGAGAAAVAPAPAAATNSADVDYTALTVTKLRAELKKRGMPTKGKKAILISRLQESDE